MRGTRPRRPSTLPSSKFLRRAWEQVRARIPCEFLLIPWFQQSSSEVPLRDWRKPGREECLRRNGCSVIAARHSTYGAQRKNSWGRTNHILSWFSNLIIVVTLPNVEWMRRDSCQTILQWAWSAQYMQVCIIRLSVAVLQGIHGSECWQNRPGLAGRQFLDRVLNILKLKLYNIL